MNRATDWLVGKGPLKETVRVAAEVTATSVCALGAAAIFIGLKRGDHLAPYEILGVVSLTYFTMIGAAMIAVEFKNDIVAFANKTINRIKNEKSKSSRVWRRAWTWRVRAMNTPSGWACQPASFQNGTAVPRRDYQRFFDFEGVKAMENLDWSRRKTSSEASQLESPPHKAQ